MHTISSLQELLNPLFPGLIGMQLTEVTPERVVGSLEVRPDLCTTGEILHGGAIMAFADTLGAVATFVNLPQGARTATIESKTNFLGAAPVGSRLTGECSSAVSDPTALCISCAFFRSDPEQVNLGKGLKHYPK
jgi:1,4-dihydroxy-2-naphthoyl-CoA hydrolase